MISSNIVTLGKDTTVTITPNPAKHTIKIKGRQPARIIIVDAQARTVLNEIGQPEISISHFSRGVYIIKLYAENGSLYYYQKLVKE
ncbi:MAG TPA: T9SS type A sorting domain-containing protein [Flavipsychrobacter sp.]|nr:T9SS type A sorting domain-containing protein [Flavipsychrobacter sp.]